MEETRKYLYVPFEEYEQLKQLQAHWDTTVKAWYLKPGQDRERFTRWLGDSHALTPGPSPVAGRGETFSSREEKEGARDSGKDEGLGSDNGRVREEDFVIESLEANVMSARTLCWKCKARIDVIGIYCKSGKVEGEPYRDFTVSNVTSMDQALVDQLKPWDHFRKAQSKEYGEAYMNFCPRCEAPQGDFLLHCEPGGPFFTLKHAESGMLTFTRLRGKVRLNGDEGFEP